MVSGCGYWFVGLEHVARKGRDPSVLQCCLAVGSCFFTVPLYVKTESFFFSLSFPSDHCDVFTSLRV